MKTMFRSAHTVGAIVIAATLIALGSYLSGIPFFNFASAQNSCPTGSCGSVDESGLRGFWGFDEDLTSGNSLIDRSPYCHAGTNVGAARVSTGRIGNALSFENDSARAVIPKASHLNNLRPMTVTGWVKPTAVGPEVASSWNTFAANSANAPTSVIVEKDSAAAQSNGWGIYTTANKRLIFWVDCGLTQSGAQAKLYKHTVNNTLPLNTWTHFAVVWTGGTSAATAVQLYINGVEASYADSADCTGTLPDDSGVDIWVGLEKSLVGNNGGTNPTLPFRGMIDDLRIYGKAMTAAEVGAINAAQCTATSCTGTNTSTTTPACSLTGANVFTFNRNGTMVRSTSPETSEVNFSSLGSGTYNLKVQTADGYCTRANTSPAQQDYERLKVELYGGTTKVYGPSAATDDLTDGVASTYRVKDFGSVTLGSSVNKLKILHAYPADTDPNSVYVSCIQLTPVTTSATCDTFTVTPSTVTQGSAVNFKWSTSNATQVSIKQGTTVVMASSTTVDNTSSGYNYTPPAVGSYTYTLTGAGAGGSCTRTVTVTVNQGSGGTQCTPNDCGNLVCEAPNETSGNCPADCAAGTVQCKPYDCGNGTCETSDGETEANCRADCPQGSVCSAGVDCGDGVCMITEQASDPSAPNYCIADCGTPPTTEGTTGRTATSSEF